MRQYILTILLIGSSIFGFSQSTFNYAYDSGQVEGSCGIIVNEDSIYHLEWHYDFTKAWLALTKLDANGVVSSRVIIEDTSTIASSGNGFFRYKDDFIIAGSVKINDTAQPMVMRIDTLGNIKWKSNYDFPGMSKGKFRAGTVAWDDTSFVLTGTVDNGTTSFDRLTAIVDSSGGLMNYNIDVEVNLQEPFSLVKGINNGYMVLGHSYSSDISGNAQLWKIDNNGADVWTQSFGSPGQYDGGLFIVPADSIYWLSLHQLTDVPSNSFTGRIMRIDTLGNIISDTILNYGSVEKGNFWGGTLLDNGECAFVGSIRDTSSTSSKGWIAKFNASGDPIWTKKFSLRLGDNYAYSISCIGSNDFLVSGFAGPDGMGASQDAWLIRLDSNGCDTSQCQSVGIKTQYTNTYKAYPNPTSNYLILETGKSKFHTANFYDISGKQIWNSNFYSTIKLDVSTWPSGIYIMQILTDGENPYSKKIIIE
ncbi:MAG: hypothetical protein ACI9J3_003151 [Parvicellaceae bacterium]